MNLLGIDIGGTKTAVSVGTEDGEIIAHERMASLPGAELDRYFTALFEMCERVLREAGISDSSSLSAVGISAPGPLDTRKGLLLAPPNNPGWVNIPVVEKVRQRFNLPIFMNNDANACALAETCYGDYARAENLIYLTTSTGMGAGIVVNGKLLQGANDMGGEVGHMVIDPEGPLCPCGRRGCWEIYVGGRNVANSVREKIRADNIKTLILDEAGGDPALIDHRCLTAAARAGDEFACEEWENYLERLAQGIGILIQAFNPNVIILGTIAVFEGDFLLQPLRMKLEKYAWSWPREVCSIRASSLGSSIADLAGLAVGRTGLGI